MSLRKNSILLVVSLTLTACSGSEGSPEPARPTPGTTAPTITTTSTIPTTTTTLKPVTIKNAPPEVVRVVASFYRYAGGKSKDGPMMRDGVRRVIQPAERHTPRTGKATIREFKGQEIGVVQMQSDVFLLLNAGKGWVVVGGKWPSLKKKPAFFGEGPRHVAVVGSDARPGQNVERTRADSIHFIGLDGKGRGAVVGLPRDSYIPVPGYGRKKVTGSLALGGPEVMFETFEDLTGLPLEGYVLTGFSGFEALMGDVLGGVEVDVPLSINDRWAHVTISAGLQILSGAEALGFARARKTVPGGDFGRSEHQGLILLSAAKAVKAMGYRAIPRLLADSSELIVTNLSPEQLLTFSAMVVSTNLGKVPNVVASGRTGTAAGASVVFLSESVDDLWADLADGRLDD